MKLWFTILTKDIGAGPEWFAWLRSELESGDPEPAAGSPLPDRKPYLYGPFHDEQQATSFADRWMERFKEWRAERNKV